LGEGKRPSAGGRGHIMTYAVEERVELEGVAKAVF